MSDRPDGAPRPGTDDAPAAPDEREGSDESGELLTPAEVAALFRVNPKTVTRWHRSGKISALRTLGGHRRFRADEIRRLLDERDERAEP